MFVHLAFLGDLTLSRLARAHSVDTEFLERQMKQFSQAPIGEGFFGPYGLVSIRKNV